MNIVTVAEKNRAEVISKICFMLSANTNTDINRELYTGIDQMVGLLENKQAKVLSPRRTECEDFWVIAKTDGKDPIAKGKVFEFATIVQKDMPFEKELIDTYFGILRSDDLSRTYEMLSESRLMLNF